VYGGYNSSPSGHIAPLNSHASPVSAGSDDGTVLFVGDLSRTVKEEELQALFAPYGQLLAVDIKRDKVTQQNLGYGFVQLASKAEATRAKLALHSFELHGRKLRVGWAQKNTTLFVGDLDGTITTASLIHAFEPYGPVIAEESFVKLPSAKYGFVRFASRDDAERAKQEMNHKVLGSRPIRIGWGYVPDTYTRERVSVSISHAHSLVFSLSVRSVVTQTSRSTACTCNSTLWPFL
jgi:RNA recognition motif-containing protein